MSSIKNGVQANYCNVTYTTACLIWKFVISPYGRFVIFPQATKIGFLTFTLSKMDVREHWKVAILNIWLQSAVMPNYFTDFERNLSEFLDQNQKDQEVRLNSKNNNNCSKCQIGISIIVGFVALGMACFSLVVRLGR